MGQLNQAFRHWFVFDGNLLASGNTVDLNWGQLGIFDAGNYQATINPTYAKNKALIFGWGQPDRSGLTMHMLAHNNSIKTHLVKGKAITDWRGHKASRGRNEKIAIGYDGVDNTKTLCGGCDDKKYFWLKLTGAPITKMFSDQGIIRTYIMDGQCCTDECDDTCDVPEICPEYWADELIRKINADKEINRFVRASKVLNCPIPPALPVRIPYTKYCLEVCDSGTVQALAAVQNQYAGVEVTAIERNGYTTRYQITQPTADPIPAPYDLTNSPVIVDCPECPTGYTLQAAASSFTIQRLDGGNDLSAAVLASYGAVTVTKINGEFGTGTYAVSGATITTPVAGDVQSDVTETRNVCVAAPGTSPWAACGTCYKETQTFRLTLADQCEVSRLADVQAAFPNLVVTEVATGTCAHQFQTTLESELICEDCYIEPRLFLNHPDSFEGISWEVFPRPVTDNPPVVGGTCCNAGVILEGTFVNRRTGECSYDYFHHEYDGIHIEASTWNPDYNGTPEACDCQWPVTPLQKIAYPNGDGHWVRKQELMELGYDLRRYAHAPNLREIEGVHLLSDVEKYYDEYTLVFNFKWNVLGWSEKYEDEYEIHFFVPEGQGKQLEDAINGYLASAAIQIDPVIL